MLLRKLNYRIIYALFSLFQFYFYLPLLTFIINMSVAGKYFIICSTTNGLYLVSGEQYLYLDVVTADVILERPYEIRENQKEPDTGIPMEGQWYYDNERKSIANCCKLCLDVVLSDDKQPAVLMREYDSTRLSQKWTLNGGCLVNGLGHSLTIGEHVHENHMARGFGVTNTTAVQNYRLDVVLAG